MLFIKRYLRYAVIVFTCLVVFGIGYVWMDETKRWIISYLFVKSSPDHKLTLAPPLSGVSVYPAVQTAVIWDASWLNSAAVAGVYEPTSVDEVRDIFSYAKKLGKQVSFSGVRHSMGGQSFGDDTLHISTLRMDAVRYDEDEQVVIVQPGATWKQVQQVLQKHGRAVAVMQDSNIFTVGGSISVNVHGKDSRFGQLVDTVQSFKLLQSNGTEILVSRDSHPDLFKHVIGGYGLFGFVTEVRMTTVVNDKYSFHLEKLPTENLIAVFEEMNQNPSIGLSEAHLNVDKGRLFEDALMYSYQQKNENAYQEEVDLSGNGSKWIRKVVFESSKSSDFGKKFRWMMEEYVGPMVEKKEIYRNEAMAASVTFLEHTDKRYSDILQEYFVPTESVDAFLKDYALLIKQHDMNLLNVTVRKVKADTTTVLSYAPQEMYGLVVYYTVETTPDVQSRFAYFTREVSTVLQNYSGTYYLCYGAYPWVNVFREMYPKLDAFLAMKRQVDPEEFFVSNWYRQISSETK